MDLLKLSVDYNGCTYWVIGDPLDEDDMRDGIIEEVLSANPSTDDDYFVEAEDIEPLITSEIIEFGVVYREC